MKTPRNKRKDREKVALELLKQLEDRHHTLVRSAKDKKKQSTAVSASKKVAREEREKIASDLISQLEGRYQTLVRSSTRTGTSRMIPVGPAPAVRAQVFREPIPVVNTPVQKSQTVPQLIYGGISFLILACIFVVISSSVDDSYYRNRPAESPPATVTAQAPSSDFIQKSEDRFREDTESAPEKKNETTEVVLSTITDGTDVVEEEISLETHDKHGPEGYMKDFSNLKERLDDSEAMTNEEILQFAEDLVAHRNEIQNSPYGSLYQEEIQEIFSMQDEVESLYILKRGHNTF